MHQTIFVRGSHKLLKAHLWFLMLISFTNLDHLLQFEPFLVRKTKLIMSFFALNYH